MSGEEIIQDLQRKISVMKKAILKERDEKQKEAEEIENLKKKITVLDLTLSEKEGHTALLSKDKEKAEKDLLKLKDQIRQYSGPQTAPGGKKSMASLEMQNKKLLDEYYFLKQQNVDLNNMITALTQEHEKIQSQITKKTEYVKKIKADHALKLKEKQKKKELLEKDLNDAKLSYNALAENSNKLKVEFEEVSLKLKNIEDEINGLSQELLIKQGNIASLNERLLRLSENEATLSAKLMDYKNELIEAEVYYQKHDVTKINSMINHPAVIIMKFDHNGNYVIEIEERKNKNVYDISSICEIAVFPNSDRRFFIRFCDNLVFDFEAGNNESVVNKLNFFVNRAKQEIEGS